MQRNIVPRRGFEVEAVETRFVGQVSLAQFRELFGEQFADSSMFLIPETEVSGEFLLAVTNDGQTAKIEGGVAFVNSDSRYNVRKHATPRNFLGPGFVL